MWNEREGPRLSLQKSSKEEVQTYPSGSEFHMSDRSRLLGNERKWSLRLSGGIFTADVSYLRFLCVKIFIACHVDDTLVLLFIS